MLCSVVLQDEEESWQARSLHIVALGRVVQWRTAPVRPAHETRGVYRHVGVSICVSLNQNKT